MLHNLKIAGVLHETPFAETKGAGIKVIRDTMEAAGLLPPYFESNRAYDQFVAGGFLPFVDFNSGGDLDGLIANIDHVIGTVPDDVRVIPGHGSVTGKAELVAYSRPAGLVPKAARVLMRRQQERFRNAAGAAISRAVAAARDPV